MARFRRIVVVGFALLAAIRSMPAEAEPLKIRIGWSTMPGHMIPVLYSKPAILKHYGTSYVVEPILFRGSSPQISAMAANEIDMGAFAPLVLNLAVTNARLNVKVVADIVQDGVGDSHSETYMVRADSGIAKIEDLKGKRIGSNAIGSASDTAMRAMLRKHGLTDKRDYTVVEITFPNMPPMLEESKIDLATILQPMSDEVLASGKFKTLFTSKDAVGPSQLVFLAARGDFLAKNRAALEDFFEDHVRAMRWFADPKNHDEAVQIIADFMKQPPQNLAYVFTPRDYYRDPFLFPNIPNIQSSIDVAKDVGLTPTAITVDPSYVDRSFVQEAKRRIEAGK